MGPQGRKTSPALSVTDNLRRGLVKTGPRGSDGIDRLRADFPRLRLLLDRAGESLPGGGQQLLALARAVASQPSLLLDEPTEGIRPSIIEELGAEIPRDHLADLAIMSE